MKYSGRKLELTQMISQHLLILFFSQIFAEVTLSSAARSNWGTREKKKGASSMNQDKQMDAFHDVRATESLHERRVSTFKHMVVIFQEIINSWYSLVIFLMLKTFIFFTRKRATFSFFIVIYFQILLRNHYIPSVRSGKKLNNVFEKLFFFKTNVYIWYFKRLNVLFAFCTN